MLLLWLTGLRAVEVFAYMTAPNARVEMYDAVVAKFDNGSIATISGAGTQPPNDPKHELDIRIFGSQGELRMDLYREWLEVHRDDNDNFRLEVQPGDGDYACDGPVNRFIDLIQGKERENPSPGDIAAKTIELIEAAYLSFASGKPEPVQAFV
jgi:predicted dehydrogenase